jgi:hypothetical protein
MNVSAVDVIARSNDFEEAATRFELRPWQWNFLHALDGRAELRDVAAKCGLDLDVATSFVEESEPAGLVRIVSMSLGDYRAWSGAQAAATAVAPASEDHFSTADSLGGYATTVPSWMIAPAHHDEPAENGHAEWTPIAEAAHEAWVPEFHQDAPVAEAAHDEWVPEFHQDAPVAEAHHEEPVAEAHHEEPVAEAAHAEWAPEFHEDAPVAEATHDEWVPEFHQDAPVAEAPHEEPVAESADQAWAPEFHHDAPVAEVHHEEIVAQDHSQAWSTYSQDTGAAKAVADLVGLHDADHAATEPAHEAERAPVSLSFGEPEPSTFATNGHSYDSTWEPMSLVTAVDPGPMPDEYDHYAEPHHEPAHDDMGGISITLGASPATVEPDVYDHTPVPEAGPSRGGISFSLSPDTAAPWHDVSTAPHYDAPATDAHYDMPAAESHDDAPLAEHHDEAPVAEHHEAVAAHADEAAAEPAATNGHIDNAPVTPSNGTSTTADIVGSLIARALTFRIK